MTERLSNWALALAALPLLAHAACADPLASETPPLDSERDAAGEDAEPDAGSSQEDDASLDADAGSLDAGEEAAALDGSLSDGAPTGDDAAADEDAYPALLSQTGLYTDIARGVVHRDAQAFEPRYALWSDAAAKQRWVMLPKKTQIDTSDMDAWVFPVGTKVFKEFRSQGIRVETRMLHKVADKRWLMVAYRWRADQRDADACPQGDENTHGTAHDIPSEKLCADCHDASQDAVLGVSALQMSHSRAGLNLERLKRARLLSRAPERAFAIPGGPVVEQALGYLHANCGHCHREGTATHKRLLKRAPFTGGPILWERTDALDAPHYTVGYRSTLNQPNGVLPELPIIAPGEPDASELFIRISQRGPGSLQMPPIGTELVDEQGVQVIRAWIESLPKP